MLALTMMGLLVPRNHVFSLSFLGSIFANQIWNMGCQKGLNWESLNDTVSRGVLNWNNNSYMISTHCVSGTVQILLICLLISCSYYPYVIGNSVIPVLQIRKLLHKNITSISFFLLFLYNRWPQDLVLYYNSHLFSSQFCESANWSGLIWEVHLLWLCTLMLPSFVTHQEKYKYFRGLCISGLNRCRLAWHWWLGHVSRIIQQTILGCSNSNLIERERVKESKA